jgi:hypothetical protein
MLCSTCVQRDSHVQTTAAAGFSGEDAVRHGVGRQKVHTLLDGSVVCPEHLRIRRAGSDVGVVPGPHEGRCQDCTAAYAGTTTPWERPSMSIHSLHHRVAVAIRPGREDRLQTTSRLRFQAHDSGDGETIFHCPFCGSGQVIARSDGTVECEFCSTAFTVQVQPTMPAFPQTIDGVPVQVPGMPAGGPGANVPPGTAPGANPAVSGPPGADDAPDGGPAGPNGGDDGGDDADDDDDKPAFLKGSTLRTAAGHALTRPQYVRHLALTCARDRATVLAQIRHDNGST